MSSSIVTPKTSPRFRLVAASLAFFLWGGWAFWINGAADLSLPSMAPFATPCISGFTQGACSFVITLVMVRLVTALYVIVPQSTRLWLPAFVTIAMTGTFLASVHVLAGTPAIARTIAPALAVAFLFNVYTSMQLQREDNSAASECRMKGATNA